MATKMAIVSDLHAHPHAEFSVLEGGVNSRLLQCVRVLDDVHIWCEENGVRTVIFCGDLFHVQGVAKTLVWDLIVEKLAKFKRSKISLVALPGNHDMSDRAGTVDAVSVLGEAGLVRTVDRDGFGRWTVGKGSSTLDVCGFAYCDDREKLMRQVERGAGADVALFHHGFKGARVGTHLERVVSEPVRGKSLRNRWGRVFSGHYHDRQPIRGLPEGWYVGSPIEHARGQVHDDTRGFLVGDGDRWDPVPIIAPRFVTLSAEDVLDLGDFKPEVFAGNFVDAFWTEYPGGGEQLKKDLFEAGAKGVKVEKVVPDAERSKTRALPAARSLAEEWTRHARAKAEDVRTAGFDPEVFEKAGLDLLHEAEAEEES